MLRAWNVAVQLFQLVCLFFHTVCARFQLSLQKNPLIH